LSIRLLNCLKIYKCAIFTHARAPKIHFVPKNDKLTRSEYQNRSLGCLRPFYQGRPFRTRGKILSPHLPSWLLSFLSFSRGSFLALSFTASRASNGGLGLLIYFPGALDAFFSAFSSPIFSIFFNFTLWLSSILFYAK
jgi:hypothetical protein